MNTGKTKSWLKHLDFIIIDIIAEILCFLIAYRAKFGDFRFFDSDGWGMFLLFSVVLVLIINLLLNTYSGVFRRMYYDDALQMINVTFYNLIIWGIILYLFKIGSNYSRTVILVTNALYCTIGFLLKYCWKKMLIDGKVKLANTKPSPLMIVGYSKDTIGRTLHDVMAADLQLVEPKVICLANNADRIKEIQGIPVCGTLEDCASVAIEHGVSGVFVDLKPDMIDGKQYDRLIQNGITISVNVEPLFNASFENQYLSKVGVFTTLSMNSFAFSTRQRMYSILKRFMDILGGIVGCVVLLPIAAIIKVIYLRSGDREPILYKQERIGKDGKPFQMFKFRTMVPNADQMLEEMLKEERYRVEWEANHKIGNDPRITKIGRILRRTSIDELPQLVNVFIGHMSMIGPRPLVEGELEMHGGLKLYQMVKPGITGWWGCNGRSNIDYRERLELEYYYVKNYSLGLDAVCFLRTVHCVLKREGAK